MSSSDLPPKRQSKAVRPVSKPLSNTRLANLIYILVGLGVLLSAFYTYRIMKWETEVGGWWNLVLGENPLRMQAQPNVGRAYGGAANSGSNSPELGLEDHINSIASIIGMKPTDLASALSNAMHEHVAPKTISSLSSSAADTSATAVGALFHGDGGNAGNGGGNDEGVLSGAGAVARAVEALVGIEEPAEAD